MRKSYANGLLQGTRRLGAERERRKLLGRRDNEQDGADRNDVTELDAAGKKRAVAELVCNHKCR